MTSRNTGDTAWVLEPILQVPHVLAAVMLTRDGLVTGYTDALSQPSAERVAAITSTVQEPAGRRRRPSPTRSGPRYARSSSSRTTAMC